MAHAGILQHGKVQLICHRTANRDLPENTLESLALAARMGCNVVEIDIRKTLDGILVLNHDDFLERLTSGMGTVEGTSSDELALLDAGAWMGERFTGMRIPRFEEAVQVAREHGIGLYLDIKTKGIAAPLLEILQREGMLERVVFGGEWQDVPSLYPAANQDAVAWVNPGCNATEVATLQRQGKFVVANFSANAHEMDLDSMRAAVAAGVDALNVDYPRLGADAVGRPVEAKLAELAQAASTGPVPARTAAIRELSHYTGFPTQKLFIRWLHDPDDEISRAAAVALVIARPATPTQVFIDAASAPEKTARQNAAWAIGISGAPATGFLLSLLHDKDADVLKEALLALSRCPGEVPAEPLLPFLSNEVPAIRGAAALALARHQPQIAATAVMNLLHRDEEQAAREYEAQLHHGNPKLTPEQIKPIVEAYREQMKLIQSLTSLVPEDALGTLADQAFRPVADYSQATAVVAGYQLWDRIAAHPAPAIQALRSTNVEVANRAEWVLVKAGASVLPALRQALPSSDAASQARIIRILGWQGDRESLPLLRTLQESNPKNKALVAWAIEKIEVLRFQPWTN
ncbi:MAG TPA: glycerophosphodiester phosphodiesterase family protein [Acidobacteriaceae bacterium]|nr:glycerophosphodiester phosphodiesterase family protein [Acidobacteriaceae bacterium]